MGDKPKDENHKYLGKFAIFFPSHTTERYSNHHEVCMLNGIGYQYRNHQTEVLTYSF